MKDLASVAVGTALASGPPHGSVREEFPHTALTSGSCDGQLLVGIQLVVRATTPVTRIPGSVSGASALVVRSPWSPSFPLRTPLPTHTRRLCSPASLVLRGRPTPRNVHVEITAFSLLRPSRTAIQCGRLQGLPVLAHGVSPHA